MREATTVHVPADLRESLVELLREDNLLAKSSTPVVAGQRFDVLTGRMAAFLVSVGAPAAADVAEAVQREPGRFRRSWRTAIIAGLTSGEETEFDRGVIIDRRSMRDYT